MAQIYPNLPGFVTDYKDGGLAVPPPPATTDTVLVIGTSQDGPEAVPVVVSIPRAAVDMFGDPSDDANATLVQAIADAYDAGARNVNAVRIGGDRAALALKEPAPSVGSVTLDAELEFTIPDPVFMARPLSMSAPVQHDQILFPKDGFSSNMLGGKLHLRYALGGVTYEVEKDVPSAFAPLDQGVIINLDADQTIPPNPAALPNATLGSANLLDTGSPLGMLIPSSVDTVRGLIDWDMIRTDIPTYDPAHVSLLTNPTAQVPTGPWSNLADPQWGHVDVGVNAGNMTVKVAGQDLANVWNGGGGEPFSHLLHNENGGRVAVRNSLQFGYTKRYSLSGAGVAKATISDDSIDYVEVLPDGATGIRRGARVVGAYKALEWLQAYINTPNPLPSYPTGFCASVATMPLTGPAMVRFNAVSANHTLFNQADPTKYGYETGFPGTITRPGTKAALRKVGARRRTYTLNSSDFVFSGGKTATVSAFAIPIATTGTQILTAGERTYAQIELTVVTTDGIYAGDTIIVNDGTHAPVTLTLQVGHVVPGNTAATAALIKNALSVLINANGLDIEVLTGASASKIVLKSTIIGTSGNAMNVTLNVGARPAALVTEGANLTQEAPAGSGRYLQGEFGLIGPDVKISFDIFQNMLTPAETTITFNLVAEAGAVTPVETPFAGEAGKEWAIGVNGAATAINVKAWLDACIASMPHLMGNFATAITNNVGGDSNRHRITITYTGGALADLAGSNITIVLARARGLAFPDLTGSGGIDWNTAMDRFRNGAEPIAASIVLDLSVISANAPALLDNNATIVIPSNTVGATVNLFWMNTGGTAGQWDIAGGGSPQAVANANDPTEHATAIVALIRSANGIGGPLNNTWQAYTNGTDPAVPVTAGHVKLVAMQSGVFRGLAGNGITFEANDGALPTPNPGWTFGAGLQDVDWLEGAYPPGAASANQGQSDGGDDSVGAEMFIDLSTINDGDRLVIFDGLDAYGISSDSVGGAQLLFTNASPQPAGTLPTTATVADVLAALDTGIPNLSPGGPDLRYHWAARPGGPLSSNNRLWVEQVGVTNVIRIFCSQVPHQGVAGNANGVMLLGPEREIGGITPLGGPNFFTGGLDGNPAVRAYVDPLRDPYNAVLNGEDSGNVYGGPAAQGFTWVIESGYGAGDIADSLATMLGSLQLKAGVQLTDYVTIGRQNDSQYEYVTLSITNPLLLGPLGNDLIYSDNVAGPQLESYNGRQQGAVPMPTFCQKGEDLPVTILLISADPLDPNPFFTEDNPSAPNPFVPGKTMADHALYSNDSNLGNKDLGGSGMTVSQFGNLSVSINTDGAGTIPALSNKQFSRSVAPPTPLQSEAFFYDADASAIVISSQYFGIETTNNFNLVLEGTFADDVDVLVSGLDILVGNVANSGATLGGFAWEATPVNVGGVPTMNTGGVAVFGLADFMFTNLNEFTVAATMFNDNSPGANAYQIALLAGDIFAQPVNEFYIPYIQYDPLTNGIMDLIPVDPTLPNVKVQVINDGTEGKWNARVRILEYETRPDIPAGAYTYPIAAGAPIGAFGRTLLIDVQEGPGGSIQVPYIKAGTGQEAILMKVGQGGSKPVRGTVVNKEHERAILTITDGIAEAGEYWYNTDVAVYLRAVYAGELYGNGVWGAMNNAALDPSLHGVKIAVDKDGKFVSGKQLLQIQKPSGKGYPNGFDVELGTVSQTNPTRKRYPAIVGNINNSVYNNVVEAHFVADSEHPASLLPQYEKEHNLLDPSNPDQSAQPGTPDPSAQVVLAGGTTGIGQDSGYYIQRLLGTQFDTGLLQLIENHPADIIVLAKMYLDAESKRRYFTKDRYFYYNMKRGIVIVDPLTDRPKAANTAVDVKTDEVNNNTRTNFGQALAEHCYQASINGLERIGVISVSPATDSSLRGIQLRTSMLTKTIGTKPSIMKDGFKTVNPFDGRGEDIGRYLSVCAGPEVVSNVTGKPATIEAVYAGRISTLSPEAATTAKPILNFAQLAYNYSNQQRDALTGMRYVTLYNFGGIIYVSDGITAAGEYKLGQASDYTRLSTVRVVHAAMAGVRRVSAPFLGQPNSIPQRIALNTAVDEFLRTMVSAGALSDYDFQIFSTREMQIIGELRIELTLTPWLELRKIRTVVSLSLPQA